MVEKIAQPNIEYRPSIFGRTARVLIPFLQKTLSAKTYRTVYDVLYKAYSSLLRSCYIRRVITAKVLGDCQQQLKTRLTQQLLPYTMGGWRALENAFEVTSLVEQEGIEGALVECGVAEGGTAAMMALANKEVGVISRQKWFFDSYEGLPAPTEEDYQNGKAGHFVRPLPQGSCLGTIEQVSNLMFEKLRLPEKEIHLVKGWFQETVPFHRDQVGPIAVLRLDGDWYESTKIPLQNFFDQVTPGGYIIVDDYATCFGSRRAVDEFRLDRNITTPLMPDGRGGVWFKKPIDSLQGGKGLHPQTA